MPSFSNQRGMHMHANLHRRTHACLSFPHTHTQGPVHTLPATVCLPALPRARWWSQGTRRQKEIPSWLVVSWESKHPINHTHPPHALGSGLVAVLIHDRGDHGATRIVEGGRQRAE